MAPALRDLYESWQRHDGEREQESPESRRAPLAASSVLSVRDGRVLVDCAATDDPRALAAALDELGMTETTLFQRTVSGWLPIGAIGQLHEIENLRLARPATAELRNELEP